MNTKFTDVTRFTQVTRFIKEIFSYNEKFKYNLGRWCHISIPNCNHDTIMRKIDFANNDNNLCNKKTNNTSTNSTLTNNTSTSLINSSELKPQDFIDIYFH